MNLRSHGSLASLSSPPASSWHSLKRFLGVVALLSRPVACHHPPVPAHVFSLGQELAEGGFQFSF